MDLFAGAGGFSLGFTRAGFECVGAVEKDSSSSSTYAKNFPLHTSSPLCLLGKNKGNILSVSKRTIRAGLETLDREEVDVLLAGPPCQGFSKVGRAKLDHLAQKKGAFKTDPRNRLYLGFLDVLRWVRPKIFLLENVVGILHLQGKNVAEEICVRTSAAGYKVRCTILNAAWFGVPQTRERVFIFGVRDDLPIEPSFPRPVFAVSPQRGNHSLAHVRGDFFTKSGWFVKVENPDHRPLARTVQEALGDLPSFRDHLTEQGYRADRQTHGVRPYRSGRPGTYAQLMRNWDAENVSSEVVDHFCRGTPRDYRIFASMKPGDRYPQALSLAEKHYAKALDRFRRGLLASRPKRRDFVPPYDPGKFEEKWQKLIPSQPSWTLTAHLGKDCYSHIHYDTQSRTITVREAARLQSFPDTFMFAGGMGDCFRQIGNAVPPLLSYALARHIRSLLKQI